MAKEVNKRVNVWINGKEVKNNVKSIRAAMVQLTNQLNKMEIGSAEYVETSKRLRELKTIYDEHCKSLKMKSQKIENNTTSWKKNIIHWEAFSAAAQGASAAIQRFVTATQEYVDACCELLSKFVFLQNLNNGYGDCRSNGYVVNCFQNLYFCRI